MGLDDLSDVRLGHFRLHTKAAVRVQFSFAEVEAVGTVEVADGTSRLCHYMESTRCSKWTGRRHRSELQAGGVLVPLVAERDSSVTHDGFTCDCDPALFDSRVPKPSGGSSFFNTVLWDLVVWVVEAVTTGPISSRFDNLGTYQERCSRASSCASR